MEKEINSVISEVNGELILSMNGMYEDRSIRVICENQELAKAVLSRKPKLAKHILQDAGEGATANTKSVKLIKKKFGNIYQFVV